MFKSFVRVAMPAVAAAAMCSSCATFVSGGNPFVTIDGNVREPVTIVTEKQIYPEVTLPARVMVNRKHIDGQRIQVSSKSKTFRDIYLTKTTNPWAWGNILIGGLVGLAIDLGTNAVSQPSQTVFYVDEATGREK